MKKCLHLKKTKPPRRKRSEQKASVRQAWIDYIREQRRKSPQPGILGALIAAIGR